MQIARSHVLVCGGTGCLSSNSDKLRERLTDKLKELGISDEVQIIQTGCFGLCAEGPIVVVYPEGAMYAKVTPKDIDVIAEEHLLKGRIVERLLIGNGTESFDAEGNRLENTDFFSRQKRVALRNCGRINPEDITEYIAFDGYQALGKVLTEMTPQQVIDVIKDSGLRGRGGAGFPTGMKWSFAAASEGDVKYVACNADEGDPGAFMDRSILEGDPHSVLEAMAIAGYAIGANQGYIYVRAEYPIGGKETQYRYRAGAANTGCWATISSAQASAFDIGLRLGAGAFVCGEETALMTSIEGKQRRAASASAVPGIQGYFRQAYDAQ